MGVAKIKTSNLFVLSWGDASQLQVGEMVLVVGNPFWRGGGSKHLHILGDDQDYQNVADPIHQTEPQSLGLIVFNESLQSESRFHSRRSSAVETLACEPTGIARP